MNESNNVCNDLSPSLLTVGILGCKSFLTCALLVNRFWVSDDIVARGPTPHLFVAVIPVESRATFLLCQVQRKSIESSDGEGGNTKKARVVWSVDMHQQFVSAVNMLGVDSEPLLLLLPHLSELPWSPLLLTTHNMRCSWPSCRLDA